eukprot:11499323-Karenia_brevis.AAC.1
MDVAIGYDQLCVVNLAAIEIVVKRRMLIESAYHGRPEAPRYDGSEHFMGFKDADMGEYIDPMVTRHQAMKLRIETEIAKEFRLKKEEEKGTKAPGGAK